MSFSPRVFMNAAIMVAWFFIEARCWAANFDIHLGKAGEYDIDEVLVADFHAALQQKLAIFAQLIQEFTDVYFPRGTCGRGTPPSRRSVA